VKSLKWKRPLAACGVRQMLVSNGDIMCAEPFGVMNGEIDGVAAYLPED